MILKYTFENITDLEKELGCTILQSMGKLSALDTKALALYVKTGLGINDIHEASIAVAKYLNDEDVKHSTFDLSNLIMEALQEQGFLPREIPMTEIINKSKAEMTAKIQELLNPAQTTAQAPSESSL